MAKRYEELTFTDDFMFCKVLQNNPDICKELTELILGRKIGDIISPENQKAIQITGDSHGVRFDVYFEDDRDTIFDIEMQQSKIQYLAKRTRYYQGMIDLNHLEKGAKYEQLKNSYIVFISRENPYKKTGLHKYSFQNTCKEKPQLEMGDGTNKIFLCAEGTQDDVSDELKAFLRYIAGETPSSEITKRLDDLVHKAREHKEWRLEYMTLLERDEQMREEGRKEGIEKGREEERANTLREKDRADNAEQLVADTRQKLADIQRQMEDVLRFAKSLEKENTLLKKQLASQASDTVQ